MILYPILILTALVVCSGLLRRSQAALPLTRHQRVAISVGAFCGAMIGAKLPFLAADWRGLLDGTAWLAHGKTILFGIVGGYLGVELAKAWSGVTVKTGDSFVVPVAVAVAIGRVGCFWGGCCYGTPTDLPWGVVFPTAFSDAHLPRHPTQLYESLFHATAAVVLAWMRSRQWLPGQLMKLYVISYLLFRVVTEMLRPEIPVWFGMTGYQVVALALIPIFVGLWWRDAVAMRSRSHT